MLEREVVERLGELLAKATPGEFVARMRKDESIYVSVGDPLKGAHAQGDVHLPYDDVALLVAAVNALPELLRVYRMWMEAPRVQVSQSWVGSGGIYAEVVTDDIINALGDVTEGTRVRLVRDGEPGEG